MLKNRMFVLAGILIVLLALAVPIVAARSEVAAGPSGNSAAWEKYRAQNILQNVSSIQKPGTPLDECFDVSLSEIGNCRNGVQQYESFMQKPVTPLDDCFDVSLSELENCRTTD